MSQTLLPGKTEITRQTPRYSHSGSHLGYSHADHTIALGKTTAVAESTVAELFSFGGATLGKAYDPGEIFGDHGVAGQPLTRPVFLEEHGKNPRLFVEASYGF